MNKDSREARVLCGEYMDRFGSWPLTLFSSNAEWARALHEAQRALNGKRGPLTREEFPYPEYPNPNVKDGTGGVS